MFEVVQIRLREGGKTSFFEPGNTKPKTGDTVIVEADRGVDYGDVISDIESVSEIAGDEPIRKVLRIATAGDLDQIKNSHNENNIGSKAGVFSGGHPRHLLR